MDADLDRAVSQTVLVSKTLERALHDSGPWTLAWGPFEVPVSRTVTRGGVEFSAEFPEACYLDPPYPVALLKCGGEVLSAKTIEHPGDGAFVIEWTLRVRTDESVA